MLSLDAALDALLRVQLRLDPGTLPDLLRWADTPEAAHSVRDTSSNVLDDLHVHIAHIDGIGPAADIVLDALRAGRQDELMPVLLAADAVLRADRPSERALVRLEDALGRHDPSTLAHAGRAAIERVDVADGEPHRVAGWLATADRLLVTWEVDDHAIRSDVLPSGFSQRIAAVATALSAWRVQPESASAARAVDAAIDFVATHRSAREERHRLQRLHMAARLIRRGSLALDTDVTTAELIRRYITDGCWLDRARVAVSQSDSEPTAAALFVTLTAEADQERRHQGAALAAVTAGVAQPLGVELLGVENVLDHVVAPLAATVPVLVVVLDGMGWPTFTEVFERIEDRGWTPFADPDGTVTTTGIRPLVAALPTVTELSRTSLLCGVLRSGSKESERRAFTGHAALVAAGAVDRPPQLFHKTDLRAGGLDAIPYEALEVISDDRNRVVGIVLNNVDERLKDVSQPVGGWGLDELTPLREILDAARSAGRAVVFTADHGHVLERDSEVRPGGGGERWRSIDSGPVGDGEIEVSGPRVVNDEHAVVLPWLEQLRYGPAKNGYHGGITLAEVVVPLAVLSSEEIPGWEQTPITAPAWWHPPIPTYDSAPPPAVPAAQKPKRPAKKAPDTISLFDEPAGPMPAPPARTPTSTAPGSAALDAILATDAIQEQLGPLRLDREVVARLLGVLDTTGGTAVAEARLADIIGYPRNRISKLLAQVQRLVNIDGYDVIATTNGEVRFDRALLERQLGL